jgi:TRAP-type mannitol/chloroaromatic compound transport system permease small subunit
MRALLRFSRVIDNLSDRLGWLAMILVVAVVAIGFFNVISRYLGYYIGVKLASNLWIELQWYLYSIIFFLGFAYILRHGINVRVDFIYSKWPKKRQALLDFWGHLFFLVPYCIIGIYVTISPVLVSWGRLPNGTWGKWEVSPDPSGLPRAPIKTMIIIAFVFLLLQAVSELIKLAAVLRGYEEEVTLEEVHGPLRLE